MAGIAAYLKVALLELLPIENFLSKKMGPKAKKKATKAVEGWKLLLNSAKSYWYGGI